MLTREQFRDRIRTQWAEKGISVAEDGRIGVSVQDLVSHAMDRNAALEMPYLDLWVEILDELQSWNISLFALVYGARKDSGSKFTNFDAAVSMVLARIVTDIFALRHLILLGFDISANVLLRSTAEYMELLVALLHDPRLADEFVKTDVPEEARRFWHRHTARGGIRSKIEAAWRDFFGGEKSEAAAHFASWGHSFNGILSGLSHPSFAGGFLSAIPFKRKYTDENWLGIWGDKSEGSTQTIFVLSAYMFPILLLFPEFPFEGHEQFSGAPITYDPENELHHHVKIGRSILASLIISTADESNDSQVFPSYDMSIFGK